MRHWLRRNLFQSPFQGAVSLMLAGAVLFALSAFIEWAFVNAVWRANSLDECRAIIAAASGEGASGACWAVFGGSYRYFLFGFYPAELHWRPILVAALAVGLVGATLTGRNGSRIACMAVVYPIVATWLIWGGFGLEPVESVYLGGFTLVLITVIWSVPIALAAGFALALGRRNLIPPARILIGAAIRTFGAVPPIVSLFAGFILSNLMLPPGVYVDIILQVIVLLALSGAAPAAQVFGRCLSQVSADQTDGARALGFSQAGAFRLVILPQVLSNAAP